MQWLCNTKFLFSIADKKLTRELINKRKTQNPKEWSIETLIR